VAHLSRSFVFILPYTLLDPSSVVLFNYTLQVSDRIKFILKEEIDRHI